MSIDGSASSVHGAHGGLFTNDANKGYQNDTLNPYFMHPNENPALVLVTPLLNGGNYHSWSRSMTVALRSKNKIHFLNGTLPRPMDEDRDSLAWDRCNTMLMSWLINSVEPEIARSVLWMDNASEIWKELRDRFYQGDVFRISDIQEEICTLKQGDLSVSAYYTKLKMLWQELENFRPIPQCDCLVTCKAIDTIRKYNDGDQVIRFLKGLNDQYYAVRSQIMLMDPLPDICKVYSLLVQQERQNVIPIDESKLFAVSNPQYQHNNSHFHQGNSSQGRDNNGNYQHGGYSQGRGNYSSRGRGNRGGRTTGGRGRGNKVCTFCGMTNHIVDNCFKKYGYPPHWPQHGVVNHIAQNDYVEEEAPPDHHEEVQPEPNSGSLSFTPEQHQAILALLQGSSSMPSHSVNHFTSKPPLGTGIVCTVPSSTKLESFILDTSATDHDSLSKMMIGVAELQHGLYVLISPLVSLPNTPSSPCINAVQNLHISTFKPCNLWHLRFGHVSNKRLIEINKAFPSVKPISSPSPCDVCFYAKQKRLPFPLSTHISNSIFDLVHMDIWGPINVPSMLGYRYFLTVVDDKSRYTWTYFMKFKSETSPLIKAFVQMVKTQFQTTVKCIRSDNDNEFLIKDFYAENDIIHQTSCVATPQQNGIVERKHQHILAVTRALLFQSHLPKTFWAHAVSHAIHIINRIPTTFLTHKSPFQILHNTLPDINFLKVFGSLCFATTLQTHRHKLDSRSRKCIHLGFKTGVKGYLLFDLKSKELFLSRDVVFYEHIFPYQTSSPSSSTNSTNLSPHPPPLLDDVFTYDSVNTNPPPSSNHLPSTDNVPPSTTTSSLPHTRHSSPVPSPPPPPPPPIRKSTRQTHPPTYLQDYHCNLLSHTIHPSSSEALHSSSSKALHNKNWTNAIQAELTALMKTNTWSLVHLPAHKRAIGCKWIFKLKLHANGTIERYKVRLVAKGFTQTEGLDYVDTFSPVVKMTTIRVLLALAASQNWHLFQLDVNTAFLHGDFNEEVYMKPPPGLTLPHPDMVCKLQKSLYGLKQASRQWNTKLTDTLLHSGYIQSKADYSLFTKHSGAGFTVILVYVDDLVLGGTDMNEINAVKTLLHDKFSIKDLGVLKYFLGFEVARSKTGISLCQRKYTLDLLEDAGLTGAKPCATPMQPHLQLHKESGNPLSDPTTYRRLIGRLLYLTHSRPEIAYTVSKLSQFLSAPTDEHMLAGLHVLKYLKNNPGKGLLFSTSSSLKIKGFSDSDWGACPDTRRSTTGFCFFIGTSLVNWKSKKQSVVSRSSSEAEYRALAQATCEGQWLLYLLKDFHITHDFPMVIYCDNQSALHIAANPVFHERTKHIEINCHVVRDKIQAGILHLLPVSSKDQVAYILTKSLHPGPFNSLESKLGLFDIHSSLRGGVKDTDMEDN
ncbi:hypothetical protein TSUD_337970 [Trifolium subterraneum]|uniref:Integrase catalytic domain-containing protein n=1 Tax=Trifolium subterraneum TaxID=3900 RepID=A0A2Z6MDC4_TRISU|nr:hypothetical protein TSUD_337970 [Trifolium subterraneum]